MEGSSTGMPQNPGFEVEVALQEDIGAELDYFIFLTLLGVDDEASEFASTVLWRHLRHFPVTAEIAGFLIARGHMDELRRLWNSIQKSGIIFENANERLFLTHIWRIPKDEDATANSWYQGWDRTLITFNQWKSQISGLILEIKIIVVTRSLPHTSRYLVRDALHYCGRLICRQMLEEASRMFSIACLVASKDDFYKDDLTDSLQDTFELLLHFLEPSQKSHGSAEVEIELTYAMLSSISYLRFVESLTNVLLYTRRTLGRLADLLQKTRELLITNFDRLPDPTLRGQHFKFYEMVWNWLADMEFKKDERGEELRRDELRTGRLDVPLVSAQSFDMPSVLPSRLVSRSQSSKSRLITRKPDAPLERPRRMNMNRFVR